MLMLPGTTMLLLAVLLTGVSLVRAQPPFSSPPPLDGVEAHRVCVEDPRCEVLYRDLELCSAAQDEEAEHHGASLASAPLAERALAAAQCLESQDALLARHPPLLACRCQRSGAARREEHCLRVYWSVRLMPGEDELEASPYEDLPMDIRMASLVAASSSVPLDGQNQCLKAAQDCGLYEKCGSLRSEYVLACTKRAPGSDRCNRAKCHRTLRRFLERVPEEYSLGVLFCPCRDPLCGERRRKTIVPSCSYQERDGPPQPNCLHLQVYCRRDDLCRSRLADFLHNCQPSPLSPSGCLRDAAGLCLRAYAGLIGTTMTPNYVSNTSADVALWCNCEGSGNQWQDCLRLQRLFTHNPCLSNAISSMGSGGPHAVENTPPPPPQPSPLVQGDGLGTNHLPDHSDNNVLQSEEEDRLRGEEGGDEEGGDEGGGQRFDVIPLYSERNTVSNLGSGGTRGACAPQLATGGPLFLLLLCSAHLVHLVHG